MQNSVHLVTNYQNLQKKNIAESEPY